MKDTGEIINLTDEQYAQLTIADQEALVALTDEQATILGKLPQQERATLYPLMSRRERRAQERAARKGGSRAI